MLVLLAKVAVLFMAGFVWTMQIVHYPLFEKVSEVAFPAYETAHTGSSSSWLVSG